MDIHVICGGKSSEHDISLRSAKSIINNLDKNKYDVSYTYITKEGKFIPIGNFEKEIEDEFDLKKDSELTLQESVVDFLNFLSELKDPLVIPVIHGTTGEDGQIEGFLETIGIKYLGNNLKSSALCFDKAIANDLFELNNIPQAKYYTLNKYEYINSDKEFLFDQIISKLGNDVYVKPASNGSSVGVSKANRNNIQNAIEEALKFDDKILIEEDMKAEELEVSVVGFENPKASLPGSYSTQREIFDYTAKYLDKNLVKNVPHKLPQDVTKKVQDLAIKAYITLGCRDFARVDIFIDKDMNLFVNEINSFPGMTPTSLSAALWEVTDNTNYSKFLDILINYALERYKNA